MPVALKDFVKNLEDSGVVSPSKLQNFLPPKAAPKDAQELAKDLVRSKTLTRYQAQEIYLGRARGLILGSYTILDKIGAGGMGQVFKAQHRRMDRLVAIKILPAAMTKDAAAVARFEREVRAAAKLEHPNIVTAHDSDESGGVHFLVMQLVEGSDLSALIKKSGPLGVEKAVDYILQAARGLEYAHEQGVIHRDIKPANLLVDAKGTVKILDMGLARLENNVGGNAATAAELTASGTIMGTVDYMAPEQALNTKHADAKSDIYSLGCTLHYLLVGKAPYDGETLMEKLLAHREQPIPELGSQCAAPAELQTIFEQMIAKQPADRYGSMREVVQDLEQCRSQLSELSLAPAKSSSGPLSVLTFLRNVSLAPRKPASRSGQRQSTLKNSGRAATVQVAAKRSYWPWAGLTGAILLLGIGGFAGWRAWHVPATEQITGATANAQPSTEKASAPSLDLLDPVNIPATERYDWQPKELVAVLGERRGYHGGEWRNAIAVKFSPDGSRLVSAGSCFQGLRMWDPRTLELVAGFGQPCQVNFGLQFSADGGVLSGFDIGSQDKMWNLAGKHPTPFRWQTPAGVTRYFWSNGLKGWVTAYPSDVTLWAPADGQPVKKVSHPIGSVGTASFVALSPSGKRVAIGTVQGFVQCFDISPAEITTTQPAKTAGNEMPRLISWNPTGDGFAVAFPAGPIELWNAKSDQLTLRSTIPCPSAATSLDYSADGKRLAAGGSAGTVCIWHIDADPLAEPIELQLGSTTVKAAISPDGSTVATIGDLGMVQLWDLKQTPPAEMFPPTGHRGWVNRVAFSPDGKQLASAGHDQTIRLWDLSGRAPLPRDIIPTNHMDGSPEVFQLRYSSDGKTLFSGGGSSTYAWDLTQPEPVATLLYTGQTVHDLFVDSQGGLAMIAQGFGNGQIGLVDLTSGKPVPRTLPNPRGAIINARFSRGGRSLVYESCWHDNKDVPIRVLLDLSASPITERVVPDEGSCVFALSPDGGRLATISQDRLKVWDLTREALENPTVLNAPNWKWTSATYVADGHALLAADDLGRVVCWDTSTYKKIARSTTPDEPKLWQLPGWVGDMTPSPDGRYLAAANRDGSVYILRIDSLLGAGTEASK